MNNKKLSLKQMDKQKNFKVLKKFLIKKYLVLLNKSNNNIVFSKFCHIPSLYTQKVIFVYNGNVYRKLRVFRFIISLRFGHFCFTRKPFKYLLKKKKR